MKTTFKKAGVMGILSLAAFGVVSASAMGFGGGMNSMMGGTLSPDEIATRQTTMFTQQASMIGATVDEVKAAWAAGKSFETLAKEKGVTEEQLRTKMQAAGLEQMKTQMTALVSKGVITQTQADQRLAFMQTKQSQQKSLTGKGNGKRGGMHGKMDKGMMGGFGF
jgi:hypothetical protein